MGRKDKIIFSRCICGYRVLFDGTDVAMVRDDGSVRYARNLNTVSSAYPYGKSYNDLLPGDVLALIKAFSSRCYA